MLDLSNSGAYQFEPCNLNQFHGLTSGLSASAIGSGLTQLNRDYCTQSLSTNLDQGNTIALNGFYRVDQFNDCAASFKDLTVVHSRSPRQAQNAAAAAEQDALTGLSTGSPQMNQARSRTASTSRIRAGRLDADDLLNPTRIDRYRDDYLLRTRGGRVTVQLNSPDFDAYLQLVNPTTGRVILDNDDGGLGLSAQMTFPSQAGVDYVLRVTSFESGAIGRYQLVAASRGNTPTISTLTASPLTIPSPDFARFQNRDGYGLVDAAAAVSGAIGRDRFADLPNLVCVNSGNDLVNAPEVWQQGFTGRDVTVAVIDTGVDYTHADLDNNVWTNDREIADNGIDDDGNGFVDDRYGWNFVDSNNNPLDDDGHGTHVAGTIAAENNGIGVTGVAYDARIMPVKVLSSLGSGSAETVAAGIRYAVANGADVINLSLGGDYPSSSMQAALREATEQGVVVVMAAGNESRSQPGYPASYAVETGISVGAVDQNRSIASFSNGAGFDSNLQQVVAPGVAVTSTIPGNQYATYSGTSMATPHVAGVAALMLSANASLTPEQVRQLMTGTATRVDR